MSSWFYSMSTRTISHKHVSSAAKRSSNVSEDGAIKYVSMTTKFRQVKGKIIPSLKEFRPVCALCDFHATHANTTLKTPTTVAMVPKTI
ncbi:hypothetical protein BELL_0019g00020 [Botrytis elliptica]|uniref:Uncharacterized protein n=1 Tax=Botrytis elliptica TaxID=278938 RepID=A0A4Z1K335_9HELO|nr:hypothetical protein BELL_0019g00020 [Botrytis elliptica]